MDLKEFIEALNGLDATDDEVADALKEHKGSIFQTIFNRGHKYATKEAETKLETLESERDAERERAAKAEAKVAKLEESQPDVKAIKREFEDEIERLQGELKDARASGNSRVQEVLDARARSDLKALLMSKDFGGIDPDYADVQAQKVADRIRHEPIEGEDGRFKLQVLVEGSDNIPVQADDPLKHLAKQVSDKVDARFKSANVDTGSGTDTGGAGGNGGDLYEDIRKDVKEKQEAKKQTAGSAAERLGMKEQT